MKRISYIIVVLVFVAFSLNGCAKSKEQKAAESASSKVPPKVKLTSLSKVSVALKITVKGTTAAQVDSLVTSPVDAGVEVVHITAGESINKGEILFELNGEGPADAGPRFINAEVAGQVQDVYVEQGQSVKSGDALVRIVDSSRVLLKLNLPQVYLDEVKVGQGVQVSVPGLKGIWFVGSLTTVDPNIDEEKRVFTVTALIRNPQGKLKLGLDAIAVINTGTNREVYIIPATALVKRNESDIVYVLEGQRVKEEKVIVSRRFAGVAQILDGLSESDQIVESGVESLSDGDEVIVIK